MTTEVERAAAAFEAGDHRAALEGLLSAWRVRREAAWWPAIDRLSRRAIRDLEPLPSKPVARHHARWLERAEEPSAAELGQLLDSLTRHRAKMARERIAAIQDHAPDPRIAQAIVDWFEHPPFTSTSSHPFWRRAAKLLPRHADAGVRERLLTIVEGNVDRLQSTTCGEVFDSVLAAALETLPTDAPTTSPEDMALLDGIATALAPREAADAGGEDALIEAIAGAPDDLSRRLVYADWLHERGHALGELINLQAAALDGTSDERRDRRISSLLRRHKKRWLGPLAPIVVQKRTDLSLGFPDEVELHVRRAVDVPPAVGAPQWCCVRTLRLYMTYGPIDERLLSHPLTRHIRRVERHDYWGPSPLPDLMAGTFERAIEHLDVEMRSDAPYLPSFAEQDRFPALNSLRITYREGDLDWLWSARWLDRLETLEVRCWGGGEMAGDGIAQMLRHPTSVMRFLVGPCSLSFEPLADGTFRTALTVDEHRARDLHGVVTALSRVPARLLSPLYVTGRDGSRPSGAAKALEELGIAVVPVGR